jgi:hypothetical protein
MAKGKIESTNGKDAKELISHIAEQYGMTVEFGKIGTPGKIEKGGFCLCNESPREAICRIAQMIGQS